MERQESPKLLMAVRFCPPEPFFCPVQSRHTCQRICVRGVNSTVGFCLHNLKEIKMKFIVTLIAALFAATAFAADAPKANAKKEEKKADAPKAEAKKEEASLVREEGQESQVQERGC